VGSRDVADDLVNGQSLANDSCAHDKSSVILAEGLVGGVGHLCSILQATFASDGIRTSRVDNNTLDALVSILLQKIPAESDGSSLELVLGKDSGGSTRSVGGEKGEIWLGGVVGLDTDYGSRSLEADGICARFGDVLLFGSGNAHGCRIGPGLEILELAGQLSSRLPQLAQCTTTETRHDDSCILCRWSGRSGRVLVMAGGNCVSIADDLIRSPQFKNIAASGCHDRYRS